MTDKETLIEGNGHILFQIEFKEGSYETSVEFTVYEATGWAGDNNEIVDTEHYLTGYVKWDGCSHFNFGNNDGYMHLCGKHDWESLKDVMDALWEVCRKKIINFDEEVAN